MSAGDELERLREQIDDALDDHDWDRAADLSRAHRGILEYLAYREGFCFFCGAEDHDTDEHLELQIKGKLHDVHLNRGADGRFESLEGDQEEDDGE